MLGLARQWYCQDHFTFSKGEITVSAPILNDTNQPVTRILNHMDEPIRPELWPDPPASPALNPLLSKHPDESAFAEFAAKRTADILALLQRKGHSYADESRPEAAWANYEEMAAFAHRSTPEEIVHAMLKHLWVIMRWAQQSNHTDDIAERIQDVMVYLLLLLFWHEYSKAQRAFDPFVKE